MVLGIHKMLIFSEVISKYVQIIIMSNSTENDLCRRQQNQQIFERHEFETKLITRCCLSDNKKYSTFSF